MNPFRKKIISLLPIFLPYIGRARFVDWPNSDDINKGFIGFCQDNIQGHSSTFQGQHFRIQELFNVLMCKLTVLFNIFASVVDKSGYLFRFIQQMC